MDIGKILSDGQSTDIFPGYIFDIDKFVKAIKRVKNAIGDMPLTYSIKANPYLLECIPEEVEHVEVCSPGELLICMRYKIAGERIIYSGVNKGEKDVREALQYGVDICSIESLLQLKIVQKIAQEDNKTQKVLLRLSSGNQFGLSEYDILSVLHTIQNYPNLKIIGVHYYSGTQKRKKQIENDLFALDDFLTKAFGKDEQDTIFVEYGPGLGCSYFGDNYYEYEDEILTFFTGAIKSYREKYNIGIELGRFVAADCGAYLTRVVDVKENDGVNYVIVDGGTHQLKYYGHNMAMQVPKISVYSMNDDKTNTNRRHYTLCGSLCTVADILVNDIELPQIKVGDFLAFEYCGAYSVTDSNVLFLSRDLPSVALWDEYNSMKYVRKHIDTYNLNCMQMLNSNNSQFSCVGNCLC